MIYNLLKYIYLICSIKGVMQRMHFLLKHHPCILDENQKQTII
ncbi:Uncharacterised protein [Yersinia nurmii]|uniref:Uncharacterized protein n=1 Tax=Yersinia nurmii TaxID=685706 RepID=A0ABM9SL59_9GAMM|nr:Uncharacterised protein [Yersinia nurmii]